MLAGEVESGDASVLYVHGLLCLLQSALGIRVYLSMFFFRDIQSYPVYHRYARNVGYTIIKKMCDIYDLPSF